MLKNLRIRSVPAESESIPAGMDKAVACICDALLVLSRAKSEAPVINSELVYSHLSDQSSLLEELRYVHFEDEDQQKALAQLVDILSKVVEKQDAFAGLALVSVPVFEAYIDRFFRVAVLANMAYSSCRFSFLKASSAPSFVKRIVKDVRASRLLRGRTLLENLVLCGGLSKPIATIDVDYVLGIYPAQLPQRRGTLEGTLYGASALPSLEDIFKGCDFAHQELGDFYRTQVLEMGLFRNYRSEAITVLRMLDILDRFGGCSSVVGARKDLEATELRKEMSAYSVLEKITLRDHSLNVAEEVVKDLASSPHKLPTALVAALAHDLGKLESWGAELRRCGNHSTVSASVLRSIDAFDGVWQSDEILRAVSGHHSLAKSGLVSIIRRADLAARRKELRSARSETDEA